MARRTGASTSFTIFAIVMAAFLILGTLVVFGGSLFAPGPEEPDSPADEAQRQIAELETRVAEDPDDADSAAVLANIYANEGNYSDAIPLFERATIDRPEDGNLRLTFGIALLRSGNILDARVQLERALGLLPEHSGPPYYLGQLEELRDEPDEEAARMWYEQAIEADPESVLAGRAQQQLEELDNQSVPSATP